MRETIFITGAGPNGVTGKLIKDRLEDKYVILAPSSKQLDLTDSVAVDTFFGENSIDYVIHCAVVYPTAATSFSGYSDVEANLRMYFNLANHAAEFKKMFYFGSGAEYDKSRPIRDVSESEIGNRIPVDNYGFVKYILNQHASNSLNIYNMRLFGTINPYEPYTKNVISNLFAKAIKGAPLGLKRDCVFSFVDIDDVTDFITYALKNELSYHDYNLTGERKVAISEVAELVRKIAGVAESVSFTEDGVNKEYSGSNERWLNEFPNLTPIEVSLKKVYDYLYERKNEIDLENIDARWKQ